MTLPYIEDIFHEYYKYIFSTLYPDNIPNKFIVYILSTLHIIGSQMIVLGIFFPVKYQPLYLLYLILIAISYRIFDNKCFITLLSNKYSKKNKSPLYLKMSSAYKLIKMYIIISIISIIFPKYSLFNLIKKLFN